ncbi:MAG TPA: sucrose phosphorylase [Anaerolineaceae bacterium]|nr:sucrose phosphorylase [Anaerolineaceae bacterium]
MTGKNRIQLITYPDALGGDLAALERLLDRHFPGLFAAIHILPPFPSTGDRGFAPVTYREIDPRFGSWADVRRLSEKHDILLDFMVNHVSRHSEYFQDFVKHGRSSLYADLFITLEKVWPGGTPNPDDLRKIFLRRPKTPFIDVPVEADGRTETVWATFGSADWSEQIDIDVNSPVGRGFIRDTLHFLAGQGVAQLRLDAVAFVIKKAGTSCFLVEPEIDAFLTWIQEQAREAGIDLLLEVHTTTSAQARLAGKGFRVYNFVLPLLVLHSLESRISAALKAHLASAPRNQVTLLDCHDGIPVLPDIQGVLAEDDAQRIVDQCIQCGAKVSRIYSPAHQAGGSFDAHQIDCTVYSALGCDDDAYIAARAIQFFSPGIPQVYYVGLLAGENAAEEIGLQKDDRAINRRNYSEAEVAQAVEKPVVQRLMRLMRFRNTYPAFDGTFSVLESSDSGLRLAWRQGVHACRLEVDLERWTITIDYLDEEGEWTKWAP